MKRATVIVLVVAVLALVAFESVAALYLTPGTAGGVRRVRIWKGGHQFTSEDDGICGRDSCYGALFPTWMDVPNS